MKRVFKRISTLCLCIVILTASIFSPVTLAASGVYELTFDNLFIFEQWANHANLTVHSGDGSTNSTLTTDIWNNTGDGSVCYFRIPLMTPRLIPVNLEICRKEAPYFFNSNTYLSLLCIGKF